MRKISEGIKFRIRFNPVVETGVPGFIPKKKEVETSFLDRLTRDAVQRYFQRHAAQPSCQRRLTTAHS
jgi:hypothetical protein